MTYTVMVTQKRPVSFEDAQKNVIKYDQENTIVGTFDSLEALGEFVRHVSIAFNDVSIMITVDKEA